MRAALYAHRFSDDVVEESMAHSQYQEYKSPIYIQPRQRLGCVKVCICTYVFLYVLRIEYQITLAKCGHFGWSWTKGCLVVVRGLVVIGLG